MKKIILWISAITRHLYSAHSGAISQSNTATKQFKRNPHQANPKPKNACFGLSCKQNCRQKATPACSKGRATIELMNAFNQGQA
jgi:hypothetical protein